MTRPGRGRQRLLILCLSCMLALPAWAAPLYLTVVAPTPDHLAFESARILQHAAATAGLDLQLSPATTPSPEFIVMPLRSLASQLPALEILELPFLFTDLNAVHNAVDGELGASLRDIARLHGWEILAFWDEGMHVMSGLRRYDRVANLNGMEFLLTRPDPVAERQFQAWRATPRTIQQADREAVLRECLIASRAATLQELQREGMERVHMTLSLTRHRYEGWLLLASTKTWASLPDTTRQIIHKIIPGVSDQQRAAAARREAKALQALRTAGFVVHEVDAKARQAFIKRLPERTQLLSNEIDQPTRQRLLMLSGISDDSNRLQMARPAPASAP